MTLGLAGGYLLELGAGTKQESQLSGGREDRGEKSVESTGDEGGGKAVGGALVHTGDELWYCIRGNRGTKGK